MNVKVRMTHAGEVNKARHCPGNSFWVATKSPDPHVFVFDWSKMPSEPDRNSEVRPMYMLQGHTQEGYGLAWSPHDKARCARVRAGVGGCCVLRTRVQTVGCWLLSLSPSLVASLICSLIGFGCFALS